MTETSPSSKDQLKLDEAINLVVRVPDGETSTTETSSTINLVSEDTVDFKVINREKVSIGEVPDTKSISKNTVDFKTAKAEERRDRDNQVAAHLARLIWYMLFVFMGLHLVATIYISSSLISHNKINASQRAEDASTAVTGDEGSDVAEEDKQNTVTVVSSEDAQTAAAMVDDTAKTIYAFLVPLVTGVTAYYFKTVDDAKKAASKS